MSATEPTATPAPTAVTTPLSGADPPRLASVPGSLAQAGQEPRQRSQMQRNLRRFMLGNRLNLVGLVLVGLGEGVLMWGAYLLAGVPHPTLFAAATAIAAMTWPKLSPACSKGAAITVR